ncbi:helix-turn-helix transcriptional regulator [Pseudomonas nitroreducens]|uniref:helix-turn-helix transcriptional regulator n=1 Tax=Pseudomonas nitroreducens TaxID=46680 RepID=UPI00381EDCBE
MKTTLLEQIRKRRKQLGLKGIDMPARTGINRQQYGLIEKAGNPNLETLDKIAEGLEAELMLIPKEHLNSVINLLQSRSPSRIRPEERDLLPRIASISSSSDFKSSIEGGVDDPWAIIEQSKGDK